MWPEQLDLWAVSGSGGYAGDATSAFISADPVTVWVPDRHSAWWMDEELGSGWDCP
jgi:hypothetical protein